jgi:MFS family permease
VYALLFADAGLSVGQISTLLLIWSLTGFLLEVPSGALADRVSRRRLLAVAALLRAAGFALWLLAPSYPAFALGFVLWGAEGAFTSGTREALVYDELVAVGAGDRYAQVLGRSEVAGTLGVLAASALAAPLIAVGGFPLAGWVSVALGVVVAAAALRLPERPRAEEAGEAGGIRGYLHTLHTGVREVRSDRRLRRLLAVAALLAGLSALDEYLPLLARDSGAGDVLVPVLQLVPSLGVAIGAELAGRRAGVRSGRVALLIAAGAVLLAAGAISGRPVGFFGIGGFYAATWFGQVVAGARLQDEMTGAARATVTSVSAVAAESVALALYAGFGLAAAAGVGIPVLMAASAVLLLPVAAVLPRWLPPRRPATPGNAAGEELAAE